MTNDIQSALDSLMDAIRGKISITRTIPCEDGSTEEVDVIVFDQLTFSTNLFWVRLCDNSE